MNSKSVACSLLLMAALGVAGSAEALQLEQAGCGEFNQLHRDGKGERLFSLVVGYGLKAAGVNEVSDGELGTLMDTVAKQCAASPSLPVYQVVRENIHRCGDNDAKGKACTIQTDSSAVEVVAQGAKFYWYKYRAAAGKKVQATFKTDGPLIWAGEGAFDASLPSQCGAGQGLAVVGAMGNRTRVWESRPVEGEERYLVVCSGNGAAARVTIAVQELGL